MAKVFKRLAGLVVVGGFGYVLFAFVWGVRSVPDHPVSTDPEIVAKGEYLAIAGDCVACHTAPGEAEMTGGLKMETPFGGAIVSTNLTPSKSGLGSLFILPHTAQFSRWAD